MRQKDKINQFLECDLVPVYSTICNLQFSQIIVGLGIESGRDILKRTMLTAKHFEQLYIRNF